MTKPLASDVLAWAEQGQTTSAVMLTAQRLIAVQSIIGKQLPVAMRNGFAVAQVKGTELTLIVDHAALAAKLRQLTPSLLQHIQDGGYNAESLKIKVATRPNRPAPHKTIREAQPLDDAALGHFETLRQTLAPGPLAEAVDRLLSHHRR